MKQILRDLRSSLLLTQAGRYTQVSGKFGSCSFVEKRISQMYHQAVPRSIYLFSGAGLRGIEAKR
ncbi:MAG: hypothetical protein DMG28_02060 [Acidobacteria bacterium]|nr:MAG: hypothetical protein DMG28_02060 [Acidobacteriota bacterium]